MSFDIAVRERDRMSRNAERRFTARATLRELMDEPCLYEDLRDCLRDLASVNRVTKAYGAVINWVSQFAERQQPGNPLHLVDVGCGGGDTLRQIERWASQANLPLRLTGIDCNPHVIRAAREFTPKTSGIDWQVGRAEALLADQTGPRVDIVISSLLTHHLSDDGVIAFLKWMECVTYRGWFVNDLYRTWVAGCGFAAIAGVMRWHSFVRHDGPVSFRRAFKPCEWHRLCAAAGISAECLQVDARWPARIYVSRVKQS